MSSDHHVLTFGVEFEFLVARLKYTFDPHPQDTRWTVPVHRRSRPFRDIGLFQAQDYIASLLASNGIPALSEHRYNDSPVEYIKNRAIAYGLTPQGYHVASHAFWMVAYEDGINRIIDEDLDGYNYVNVEIASRILRETEFYEVARVYHLLQSNIRTQVNSSCGLHYHIGISHLTLESRKKLVTILMMLEAKGLFAMVCAPYRATHPEASAYSQYIYKYSKAAMVQEGGHMDFPNDVLRAHLPPSCTLSPSFFRTLTRIWNCQSTRAIANATMTRGRWAVGDPSCFSFNIRGGFAIRGDTADIDINGNQVYADPTIEIRYRESTGSALQDYRWLKLCLSIVRAAEWPQTEFRGAVGGLYSADTLTRMLRCLRIGEDDIQWWWRMEAHYCQHPHPSKKMEFLMPENF
ncbi:hypothetical protein VMCG_06321 [Cytospora schulzeri]|uniref:Amidoligase enzyme n=1 Tax=Cytospora schulzeri TaxID=448051 RepID=A0A423W821_9PEZI|nr:hypothetical protein VMCG_06321 [Valsa malicola]